MPHSQTPSQRDRLETLLHQVRNPLTALNTFAGLLEKRSAPDDPNLWIVERIRWECKHVQELLEAFEIEDGLVVADEDAEEDCGPLFLRDFLASIWPIYDTLAKEQGIRAIAAWDTITDTDSLAIPALSLRQVLDNLIDNALKYSPAGGQVTLAVRVNRDTHRVQIAITDTGPGIDPDALPQIFERHYRLAEEQPGQGLGLAIARQLVEEAGGTLTAQSVVEQGTTFTLEIPLVTESSPEP